MTGSSNARMKERTVRLFKFAGPLMGGCTVQYVSSGFSPLWADAGSLDSLWFVRPHVPFTSIRLSLCWQPGNLQTQTCGWLPWLIFANSIIRAWAVDDISYYMKFLPRFNFANFAILSKSRKTWVRSRAGLPPYFYSNFCKIVKLHCREIWPLRSKFAKLMCCKNFI